MENSEYNNQTWMTENLVIEGSDLFTWEEALSAVPEGWRLPTKKEWEEVLPLWGDGGFFPDYSGEKGFYWTATESARGLAWCAVFEECSEEAFTQDFKKDFKMHVRCVKILPY